MFAPNSTTDDRISLNPVPNSPAMSSTNLFMLVKPVIKYCCTFCSPFCTVVRILIKLVPNIVSICVTAAAVLIVKALRIISILLTPTSISCVTIEAKRPASASNQLNANPTSTTDMPTSVNSFCKTDNNLGNKLKFLVIVAINIWSKVNKILMTFVN